MMPQTVGLYAQGLDRICLVLLSGVGCLYRLSWMTGVSRTDLPINDQDGGETGCHFDPNQEDSL